MDFFFFSFLVYICLVPFLGGRLRCLALRFTQRLKNGVGKKKSARNEFVCSVNLGVSREREGGGRLHHPSHPTYLDHGNYTKFSSSP